MSTLTRQDFVSDQEIRWCPGCGDYAILTTIQKTFPTLGIPKENIVFVSGIGCSGRLPYYMNTYGFHTIHGRAPAVASGLKIARPELSVWVITGDGDGLSIGASHLMHLLRRNVDIKVLLLNNRIYGLTKGQYSPTSEQGKITRSTPQGSIDRPVNPIAFALAAEATFVARALDIDAKNLSDIIQQAAQHQGSAFIEIYQNCNIFNDGAFASLTDKQTRDQHILWLEQGKKIKIDDKQLDFVHDIACENSSKAFQLSQLDMPVPMGIFRMINKPSYERLAKAKKAVNSTPDDALLDTLLRAGHTWEIL